jgi:hypothetical protein
MVPCRVENRNGVAGTETPVGTAITRQVLLSGRMDAAGWFAYGTVTLVEFEAVLSTPKASTLVTKYA